MVWECLPTDSQSQWFFNKMPGEDWADNTADIANIVLSELFAHGFKPKDNLSRAEVIGAGQTLGIIGRLKP